MRITIRKSKGAYGIYKNGKKIDEETTKAKALDAARFYRGYFKQRRKRKKIERGLIFDITKLQKILG